MKILKNTGFLAVLFLAFISCQKEHSIELGNGPSGPAQWEFKEGAAQFKGPMDTATIDTINGIKVLSMEGTSLTGGEKIELQVYAQDLKPGTYRLSQAIFTYSRGGSFLYENDVLGDFSIVIDKIDSFSVSGTFSGKVLDSSGASKTVTEGKFAASLKKGTVPNGTGQAVFWAAQACSANATGPVTIKIGGQTQSLTTFSATEPSCGGSGGVTFNLPAGTYTWKAFCGANDSTSGTVTVVANNCLKVKVSFVTPSNCKITKWLEYNISSGKPEWSYVSTFGANINTLQKFELYDSATSQYLGGPFNFTYSAGKIQVDPKQYFVTDASGRATEFHGHPDPTFDSAQLIVKYTYNATGQLIKRTEANETTPNTINFQYDYTYTNGNLTKTTVKNGASLLLADIVYEYDASVTVKSFLSLFAGSAEITLFQQGINIGAPTNSAKLTKATVKIYDMITITRVSTFDNYVIDPATNYVTSFEVKGDDCEALALYSGYRYRLEYKCF